MKNLDMQNSEEKYKTYFILYKYVFSENVDKINYRIYRESISFYYFNLLNKKGNSTSIKDA